MAMAEEIKISVAAKISAESLRALDEQAEATNRTRSQLISFAIDEWLERQPKPKKGKKG